MKYFLILALNLSVMGCASTGNKTTLLLDEIRKEQPLFQKDKNIKNSKELWESAKIQKRWIPAHYKGNRVFVPGHFEYIVTQAGHWKRTKGQK